MKTECQIHCYGYNKYFSVFFFLFRNPNSNTDRYLQNIIWSPMHVDQMNYLDIDDFPTMKDHLNKERYHVWERLFPIDKDNDIDLEEDEVF